MAAAALATLLVLICTSKYYRLLGVPNIHRTAKSQVIISFRRIKKAAVLGSGLTEEDLIELDDALGKDGARDKQSLGDNVKSWMGRMITKTIDGTWKVGTEVAATLLKNAISSYYGWE